MHLYLCLVVMYPLPVGMCVVSSFMGMLLSPVDPFPGILKAVLGLREANQVPVLLHSGDPEGVCRGKIQTGRSGGELYFHC